MKHIEQLLDQIFPFVEQLLKEYGEFYPLAAAIDKEGNFIQIDPYEEDDNPPSETVINDLKQKIQEVKDRIEAFVLFYDVRLKDENTDAIAVMVESKTEESAYTFYFPYTLNQGELKQEEPWKVSEQFEILR